MTMRDGNGPMRPDELPASADWPKRSFDFPGLTCEELVRFALGSVGGVEAFLAGPGGSRAPRPIKAQMRELLQDLLASVRERPGCTVRTRDGARWLASMIEAGMPDAWMHEELSVLGWTQPVSDRRRLALELLAWASDDAPHLGHRGPIS